MQTRLLIFLLLNFGALALGGLFTGKGVSSDWYFNLNKAPWTPPGWVFGAAWTLIMVTFSVYLALLWPSAQNKGLLMTLFGLQWVLNIAWNPSFFYFQQSTLSLVLIVALTLLVLWFFVAYWSALEWKSLLILPYALWLVIATSLNWYIVLNN